jgi:hypothetical protein
MIIDAIDGITMWLNANEKMGSNIIIIGID